MIMNNFKLTTCLLFPLMCSDVSFKKEKENIKCSEL